MNIWHENPETGESTAEYGFGITAAVRTPAPDKATWEVLHLTEVMQAGEYTQGPKCSKPKLAARKMAARVMRNLALAIMPANQPALLAPAVVPTAEVTEIIKGLTDRRRRRQGGAAEINLSHWSYSNLALYDMCPLAWKMRYVLMMEDIPTEAQIRGQLFHEGAEKYGRHCFSAQLPSDWDWGRELADSYPVDVADLLTRWIENSEFDWGHTLTEPDAPIERLFSTMLPNGEKFVGRLDLVQRYAGSPFGDFDEDEGSDLFVVTDIKSGHSRGYVNSKLPDQGACYLYLLQANVPEAQELEFRYWCAGSSWQPSPWRVVGDLSGMGRVLATKIRRIRADRKFEAITGMHCLDSCNYWHVCPLMKEEVGNALEGIKASDPANSALMLEKAKEVRIKLLKGRVEAGETVLTGDGAKWDWWPRHEWRCKDRLAAEQVLQRAGKHIGQLERTRFDAHAVERALTDKDIGDELSALFEQVVVGRNFEARYPQKHIITPEELFGG